jgi:hypothetical protein
LNADPDPHHTAIYHREIFELETHCLLFLNCRVQGGVFRNDAASVLSSEIDTTSFFDTEDNESMASSRLRNMKFFSCGVLDGER